MTTALLVAFATGAIMQTAGYLIALDLHFSGQDSLAQGGGKA